MNHACHPAKRKPDDPGASAPETLAPEVVDILVQNHRNFLAFLERRLGDRAEAEELLQRALVRGVERGHALRDEERAVAWFYRVLRNALTDHWRRRDAERRALERRAAEPDAHDEELERAVCACLNDLVPTLRDEYAQVLRRVDLEEAPVAEVAAELGITANNLRVRLHRARQALKKQLERVCGTCAEHGCLDCHCGA